LQNSHESLFLSETERTEEHIFSFERDALLTGYSLLFMQAKSVPLAVDEAH
jgi:hypothetical protein